MKNLNRYPAIIIYRTKYGNPTLWTTDENKQVLYSSFIFTTDNEATDIIKDTFRSFDNRYLWVHIYYPNKLDISII